MTAGEHDDVTVVITCFDYGAYLHEAIASALEQDGGAPWVIVVDDGSTDPATLEALEALERLPAGVQLIRQDNQGLAAARNTGMRAATTPLLLPLDADDKLAPGALRALRAPLDADPAIGFSYGISRFFGDWNREIPMPPLDPYRMLHRSIVAYLGLMRREVFETVGGYEPFGGYEDWDFWLGAVARGIRGVQVPAVTHLYRHHGESMIAGSRRNYHELYARLRRKHAPLYARRRELARTSAARLPERLLLRFWWAPRPLPPRVERALYGAFFSRGRA